MTTFLVSALIAILSCRAALEDVLEHRLRDVWSGAIAGVALVGVGIVTMIDDAGYPLADMLVGVVCFAGIPFLVHLIRPGEIGFGDIKFSAALGLPLGYHHHAATILYAALVVSLLGWISTRIWADEDGRTPLGPAIAATAVALIILGTIA